MLTMMEPWIPPAIQLCWFGSPLVSYFRILTRITLSPVLRTKCNGSPALETATPELVKRSI